MPSNTSLRTLTAVAIFALTRKVDNLGDQPIPPCVQPRQNISDRGKIGGRQIMFWAHLTHEGTLDLSLQTKPIKADIAGIQPKN